MSKYDRINYYNSKTEKEILQILDSNNFISIEEVKKELKLITS